MISTSDLKSVVTLVLSNIAMVSYNEYRNLAKVLLYFRCILVRMSRYGNFRVFGCNSDKAI